MRAAMASVRPMYVFTVLALLLLAVLYVITHADLKPEVDTILTTTAGGLLALLGTVVNHEFGSAKSRENQTRAADHAGAPDPSGVTSGAPAPAPTT